jgi:sugar phosphate isomerase/epimerase
MPALKLKSLANVKEGVRWGYALGWYREFGGYDEDEYLSKLKFLLKYNFKSTYIPINELDKMDERRKDAIFGFLAANDLDLMPILGFNYVGASADNSSAETAKKETERQLNLLGKYAPLLRNRICHTGLNAGHRFDGARPVEETLDLISRGIGELAEGCAQIGTPLCAENHGDYYVSDLVKLCQITPHMYIFLDTGNTYLLGEKPLPAFYEAAPYTIGSHFKDQRVRPRPEASPLNFEVGNSDIGGGMVPLRECWDILRKYAPDPDNLTMMFEMFAPPGMDPVTSLENSIKFVRSLEGSTL